MVAATRLDCVLGSTALMRRAIAEASWHAAHRSAFGRTLADQPAMAGVLADLQLEYEGAVHLALRLAAAVGSDDPHERALLRIGLPLAKFWVCKRTPTVCVEAMECLGGNGYVDESGLPLLVRESPLNSIWEGSGTVNALDLLRAVSRTPDVVDAWRAEVARAGVPGLDRAADELVTSLAADPASAEASARRTAARAAVLLQAALLARHAPTAVADAFARSRVDGDWAGVYGTLPAGTATTEIAERAHPAR